MDAEKLREALLGYLDGTLDEAARADFERRMARSPKLARAVRQHQQVDHWLDDLKGTDPSTGQLASMAERILEDEPASTSRGSSGPGLRLLRRPAVRVAAAAVLLVSVGLLFYFGRGLSGEGDAGPGLADTGPSASDSLPAFLEDPEFAENFEVIRDLGELEKMDDELVLPTDEQLFDVVALQVLSGA